MPRTRRSAWCILRCFWGTSRSTLTSVRFERAWRTMDDDSRCRERRRGPFACLRCCCLLSAVLLLVPAARAQGAVSILGEARESTIDVPIDDGALAKAAKPTAKPMPKGKGNQNAPAPAPAATATTSPEPPAPATPRAPPPEAPSAEPSSSMQAPSPAALPASNAVAAKDHGKPLLLIGLGYRANWMPSAVINVFADTDAAFLFDTASLTGDIRWRQVAIVPSVSYTNLSSRPFLVRNKDGNAPGFYSALKSDLSMVAVEFDILHQTEIASDTYFEFGGGLGAGFLMGTLRQSWVYETTGKPPSPSSASYIDGRRTFQECRTVDDGFGCRPQDHIPPRPVRLPGFSDVTSPGGVGFPVLPVIPLFTFPQIGFRTRLAHRFHARVATGLSTLGFFFGTTVMFDAFGK